MSEKKQTIAVIGGSGGLGSALALRWGQAGYNIIIGSRNAEKAGIAADRLNKLMGLKTARGLSNYEAANTAEIIVLTVPFSNHMAIVEEISVAVQAKIVVDTTVPLVPPKVSRVQLPEGGSVAKQTQEKLGKKCTCGFGFSNNLRRTSGRRSTNRGRGAGLRK